MNTNTNMNMNTSMNICTYMYADLMCIFFCIYNFKAQSSATCGLMHPRLPACLPVAALAYLVERDIHAMLAGEHIEPCLSEFRKALYLGLCYGPISSSCRVCFGGAARHLVCNIYMYTCRCIHIQMYTYIDICAYVNIHVYIYVYIYVCFYICMYTYVYIYIYGSMYLYVYVLPIVVDIYVSRYIHTAILE